MLTALGESDDILSSIAGCYWQQNKRDLARQTCLKFKDAIRGQSNVASYWREDGKPDQAIAIYRPRRVPGRLRAVGG